MFDRKELNNPKQRLRQLAKVIKTKVENLKTFGSPQKSSARKSTPTMGNVSPNKRSAQKPPV